MAYCNYAQAQKNLNSDQISLITAIHTVGKNYIAEADFVQMLTGKAAVKAARKAGEAEYNINKEKDTIWYVPNDFFVLNSNPEIRQLQIFPGIKIYLLRNGSSILIKSSMLKLKNNFTGKLFRLTLKQNQIIKLEEIYTP